MGSLTARIRRIFCGGSASQKKAPTRIISFQQYLNRAYKTAKDAHELGPTELGLRASISISIYLRGKGPHHVYGGVVDEIDGVEHHLDLEEYFSGSLPKVAAMFAAYKLRNEARLLIKALQDHTETATATNFFTKLEPRLHLGDTVLSMPRWKKLPTGDFILQPSAAGSGPVNDPRVRKKPLFEQILTVTGNFADPATLQANFTDDFRSHMRKMIIPSDNCSAGECIARLSYPYINVALIQDGYFNKDTMKGIWLCGDYILTSPPFKPQDACPPSVQAKKQPFIRLDTVNDCDQTTHFCGSAQNTTSREMSRLFLNILLEQSVDADSSREMHGILHEAQHGSPDGTVPPVWPDPPDSSFLTREGGPTLLFKIDGVKIGQGPIKRDPNRDSEVRSEGLLIKWKKITPDTANFDAALKKKFDDLNLTGEAAVCWQNLGNGQLLDGIANVINNSISDYINQASLTP